MNVLGVIPARGGSKGLPGKNIKLLAGLPLIAHSIRSALAAKNLTRVIVSTDSPEIAETAKKFSASVPFLRPAELASDKANALPVMQHALKQMETLDGLHYDAVMMLQPTTPLRLSSDIDGAVQLLKSSRADSVISVVDVEGYHPARMKYIEGNRLIDPSFCEAYENQPRQELPAMYIRNGAIYLTGRETLLGNSFKGKDCRAWIMPGDRSVNIDTEMDFRYAEWILGNCA